MTARGHLHAPGKRGERAADAVAAGMGSWLFVGIQTLLIIIWAVGNVSGVVRLDPWPLIFLNLCLSTQAAYAAPILQMASNRQSAIDRARDDHEAEEVSRLFALQEQQMAILEQQTALAIQQHQEMTVQLAALLTMVQPWDARR